jgi:hypothetical protein
MPRQKDDLADALTSTLQSVNECDRNGEPANVVDGLFAIARAIHRLAEAVDRATEQRAVYGD